MGTKKQSKLDNYMTSNKRPGNTQLPGVAHVEGNGHVMKGKGIDHTKIPNKSPNKMYSPNKSADNYGEAMTEEDLMADEGMM